MWAGGLDCSLIFNICFNFFERGRCYRKYHFQSPETRVGCAGSRRGCWNRREGETLEAMLIRCADTIDYKFILILYAWKSFSISLLIASINKILGPGEMWHAAEESWHRQILIPHIRHTETLAAKRTRVRRMIEIKLKIYTDFCFLALVNAGETRKDNVANIMDGSKKSGDGAVAARNEIKCLVR